MELFLSNVQLDEKNIHQTTKNYENKYNLDTRP